MQTGDDRVLEYIRRAEEAEFNAATGDDPWAMRQWRRIAMDYRELVQMRLSEMNAGEGQRRDAPR